MQLKFRTEVLAVMAEPMEESLIYRAKQHDPAETFCKTLVALVYARVFEKFLLTRIFREFGLKEHHAGVMKTCQEIT